MTSQQLSFQLYKWLTLQDILPSNLRYKSNGNFQLDSKTTQNLLNGFLISKLVVYLAQEHNAIVNQPLLSSIKQSNTPAARLYNWNILTESFVKLNITITKQMQKQITSGNFPTLVRFLLDLHKRFNPKVQTKKQEEGVTEINIKKIQFLSSYDQAQSFLELIIMIISQKLNLTPKQTVSTLSQNAKYYAHMIVKGLKNGFQEIIDMLQVFITQMPKIMYQCEKSPQKNTQFFLDLIKPTLISRQTDVAKKGAELFKVFIDESLKYNSKNLIYQILTKENFGFDFLYMAIKRHPDLANQYTAFLYPLIKDAFKDFFQVHLKRTINNQQQYVKIILKLLQGLVSNPQSKLQLKQSTILHIWIKNSQESFNIKKNKEQNPINEETKILYLELLCNLWKQYSSDINQEQGQEILMKGIEELKRNARKSIFTIKIPAILRLFDFLHFLADAKNKVASILYKKLIFLFIQNHEEEQIRQIIVSNFIIMLKKYPTIPIEFLAAPLLKQLITAQGTTYILNIFDFDFFLQLCKHPRMDVENALSYLQYFSKLYTKEIMTSKLVMRIIELLTNRFCQEQTIVQFLKRNITNNLNLYGLMTFNRKKNNKQTNIINKQKRSLMIELLKHYISLEHRQLSYYILGKICKIYIDWHENKKLNDKGLKYLINLYGDFEEIIMQYKIKENQKLSNQIPSEPGSLQDSPSYNRASKNRSESKNQAYTEEQYMKRKGIGYKKYLNEDLSEKSIGRPDPKVLKDIQKLKAKLKNQVDRKKQQQSNQIKKLTIINNQNSLQLLQRNLSLGYAKLLPLQQDKIIFEFDTVKPKQLKRFIKFYDLSELQQIDQTSTQVILKQYNKEIKSLFLKYALISSVNQYRKEETNAMMSFTEIVRMVHEKNIENVSKIVISDMISSINQNKHKQKNLLSGIFQQEFHTFLIRLTDYLIQNQNNTPQLPFGLKLQNILKKLFKGEHFYENKFRIKEQLQIIKLRQLVNNNDDQNIQMPQGYKKVKQNVVLVDYKCNLAHSGAKAVYQFMYEVSDWLISKALGFHIITPFIEIKSRYTIVQIPKPIKPKMNKQQTQPKIKYQNEQNKPIASLNTGNQNPLQNIESNKIISKQQQNKKSQKINKKSAPEKRTLSQRQIKNKKDPKIEQQQQRKQHLKQQKYAEQLRINLQKLRTEKANKLIQQKKKQQQQKNKLKKKQQQRKKYLQQNKQKIKQRKLKEQSQKLTKQQQQKQKRQLQKQQNRIKQQQLFQKQKQAINLKREKISEKKKQIEKQKERKNHNLQKLAKQITAPSEDSQKLKMIELKNNLQNGQLKDIAAKYQKQFTDLFQSYWVWDKKRIELSGLALMLKDFHISPQYISPKAVAQVYKHISKGQLLDYNSFIQLLVKCSYKSQKLMEQFGGQQKGQQQNSKINPKVFKGLIQKLRLSQANYKEIIKNNKHHLQ